MQEGGDLLTQELEVTGRVKNHLAEIVKWARLLGITGLLFCILMIAASFYTAFYISDIMAKRYGFSIGQAISAVYIFLTAALLYPCISLYRFSVTLHDALKNNTQENFEIAFMSLRSAFKYLGIGTGIILLLWLMSFILLVVHTF